VSDRDAFPWRFTAETEIRFGHCDPAGIAYFPRLDELLNGLLEDWCAAVGFPFAQMIHDARLGFPLVHADVDYEAPLRLGDRVVLEQVVHAVGNSSLTLDLAIRRGTERCLRARHVRVMIALDSGQPVPLAPALRAALASPSPSPA
jgi:4-hydroxybenzoyl-CoA thioesterase